MQKAIVRPADRIAYTSRIFQIFTTGYIYRLRWQTECVFKRIKAGCISTAYGLSTRTSRNPICERKSLRHW